MDTIIKQNGVTFKELEKNIYSWICEIGQLFTQDLLERYDKYLRENRNKKIYRDKGLRKTSIKTVYGEVAYRRTVYEVRGEDGRNRSVYLLDETLDLSSVGLISENLAEQLVSGITELSYRECAGKISDMTGQSISAMGVWNVIQALGEDIYEEEEALVEANKQGKLKGSRKAPVLFEEADGVYLNLQGKDREKSRKAELKVGLAYDGWKKEENGQYSLDETVMAAGFDNAKDFQEYREALIAERYDLDETEVRILNADGAAWLKKIKDKETYFQLDPFHRNKAIRENITDKRAIAAIRELLDDGDIDGMFEYLHTYRDSLSDQDAVKKADRLIQYFKENRDGLLPYQQQDTDLPESPEGLEFHTMGTMENHIWSVITKRMKHGHRSWSLKGGENLAKLLAKKGSGRLWEVTDKLKKPLYEAEKSDELHGEILSAARTERKDGKGYEYPMTGHLFGLDMPIVGDRNVWKWIAGLMY